MRSIEASGKTVKDAIRNGLAELGCDSDDVDIQVIEMGSPGLFGMFGKPAKVRLTVKADDPALEIEMPVLSLDASNGRKQKQEKRKAEKPAPKVEKPAPKAEPVEEAADEDEEAPKKGRSRRRRRGGAKGGEGAEGVENAETQESAAPAPIIEHEPFVPTPEEEQSEEAKRARAFLSGLTERMGVPVEIALQESAEQLRMRLFFLPLTPQSVECYENPHPETVGVGAEFGNVFEAVARRLAGAEIGTRDIYGIGTAVNGCDADFLVSGGSQQLKRLHYLRASSIFLASAPYLGSLRALV